MTDKAERVASYEVPQVQVLLKMFTDGNISELAPEIHPVHGALYPKMEEVTANGQKAKALLEQLVQAGILRDLHFVDRLLPNRRLALVSMGKERVKRLVSSIRLILLRYFFCRYF